MVLSNSYTRVVLASRNFNKIIVGFWPNANMEYECATCYFCNDDGWRFAVGDLGRFICSNSQLCLAAGLCSIKGKAIGSYPGFCQWY